MWTMRLPPIRIWFWVKDPTDDSTSHFNWNRDNIYGATVLLGAGGATCLVMSLAFISYMIGRFTVSMKLLRDGCFIKAFLLAVYVIHNACGLSMMFNLLRLRTKCSYTVNTVALGYITYCNFCGM